MHEKERTMKSTRSDASENHAVTPRWNLSRDSVATFFRRDKERRGRNHNRTQPNISATSFSRVDEWFASPEKTFGYHRPQDPMHAQTPENLHGDARPHIYGAKPLYAYEYPNTRTLLTPPWDLHRLFPG